MRHGEELDNRNSKRAVKADYVSSIVTALLDRRCRKKARVDQRGSGGWFNDSGKASQKTRPSVPMRSSQRQVVVSWMVVIRLCRRFQMTC